MTRGTLTCDRLAGAVRLNLVVLPTAWQFITHGSLP
jgi:hypothetical protein